MANGREGVRTSGSIDIDTLLFDVNGVLAVPKGGMSRPELVSMVASETFGQPLIEDPYEVDRVIRDLRLRLATERSFADQDSPEYWAYINMLVYKRYGCTREQAIEISRRITDDPELYEIPVERQGIVRYVVEKKFGFGPNKENCMVVTASNSESFMIEGLLRRYNMRDLFHRIYCGDELGGLYKPDPQFFLEILRKIKSLPERTLVIGNSPFKDLVAAKVGINVIWVRNKGETVTDEQVIELHGADAWTRIHRADTPHELVQIADVNFRAAT